VVSVNGVDVSQHRTEREAIESALNRVLPGKDVRYRHDYLVVVQSSSTGSTTPTPLSGLSASFGIND
jgi:hypothetical protein